MKNIIAICLISLMLFNAWGFYGLMVGLRYQVQQDLMLRLDNHQYAEDQTVMIKIRLVIPYHIDDEDYYRVDGEIEHNGQSLRLIKQKIEKDTLYLVCIKDYKSKQIKQALSQYLESFTDKPIQAKHNGKMWTSFIKDYLPGSFNITHQALGWHYLIAAVQPIEIFTTRPIPVLSPPPQR